MKQFKKHKMNIAILLMAILMVLPVLSYGCKPNGTEETSETVLKKDTAVYYINRDKTRIQGEKFSFTSNDPHDRIEEMIAALSEEPKHKELKASLGEDFSILGYTFKEGILTLDMDKKYKDLKPAEEILVRAAFVRSFAQIPEVSYVQILINGEGLTDANGNPVGYMNEESFVENDGKEINAYEKATVTLYFATEDGKNLITGQRQVVYNTNVSMEKMVMEQLIKGPVLNGYYPTINPDTKILSVTNKDGICYVNLSEEFLKQPNDISSEVVIYSIANSLIDLHNVNRVQIQVNGNSKILFRETISLEDSFERNLDIVLQEEQ